MSGKELPDKEYLTLDEVAAYVGLTKAGLYPWIKYFKVDTHKFQGNRCTFMKPEDAKRLREIRDKPWLGVEKPSGEDGKSSSDG